LGGYGKPLPILFLGRNAGIDDGLSGTVLSFGDVMRAMIDDFPDAWKNRLALKSALQRGVKGLVRRFSFSLSTGRYYEPFSFKRAAEVCGIEQADLILESLAGVAEGTEEIESFEFFNIAGLIAVCLRAARRFRSCDRITH